MMMESSSGNQIRVPALRVLMMPRDTNAHGTVFGGVILSYIDQAAAVATRDYPPHRFVTAAMDGIEFKQPVYVGDLLSLYATVIKIGRTSLRIRVEVDARRFADPTQTVRVTSAELVYVAVDARGRPTPLKQSKC